MCNCGPSCSAALIVLLVASSKSLPDQFFSSCCLYPSPACRTLWCILISLLPHRSAWYSHLAGTFCQVMPGRAWYETTYWNPADWPSKTATVLYYAAGSPGTPSTSAIRYRPPLPCPLLLHPNELWQLWLHPNELSAVHLAPFLTNVWENSVSLPPSPPTSLGLCTSRLSQHIIIPQNRRPDWHWPAFMLHCNQRTNQCRKLCGHSPQHTCQVTSARSPLRTLTASCNIPILAAAIATADAAQVDLGGFVLLTMDAALHCCYTAAAAAAATRCVSMRPSRRLCLTTRLERPPWWVIRACDTEGRHWGTPSPRCGPVTCMTHAWLTL